MLTNDLHKGDMVILENGWRARIEDNRKGSTRLATVYGLFTEMGSVYASDIIAYLDEDTGIQEPIELTDRQRKAMALRQAAGF